MSNRSTNFLLKLSVLAALLLFTFPGYAQAIYSIKVKLSDAKTSEPVAYATASVSVKGESSALKYVLTDANGEAVIPKLKKGTYVFKAELMGRSIPIAFPRREGGPLAVDEWYYNAALISLLMRSLMRSIS